VSQDKEYQNISGNTRTSILIDLHGKRFMNLVNLLTQDVDRGKKKYSL
jgi:hypothetical protein